VSQVSFHISSHTRIIIQYPTSTTSQPKQREKILTMSQPTFLQKTALVTGGCGGLGRAISEAFLRAGANVVVVDINPELIADFKEKVSAAYPECTLVVQADITKDEKIEEVFSEGEKMFGELDFVVNCAGRIDRFDAVAEMVRSGCDLLNMLSDALLLTFDVSPCRRGRCGTKSSP
jgi:NAD(P)-dependent dehydrogenase (short-subunit alcohol dehydrogenase family)